MEPNQAPSKPTLQLGARLAIVSLVLFYVYTATVLGSVLPPRLLDPVWQLALAGSLINNAPLALLGLAGLHLAAHLEPGNPILGNRRLGAARWAQLAVAGYLLLVPLQLMAVWQTLQARETVQNRQLVIADRRIAEVRRAITSSTTVEQLQAELARLKMGTLTVRGNPADRSLSAVRAKLLSSLEGSRSTLQYQFKTSGTGMIWSLIQRSLQGIVSSIALAIGFAALSERRGSSVTLLEEWHSKRLRFRPRWPSIRRQSDGRTLWKQR